jgi:hypothetical protein
VSSISREEAPYTVPDFAADTDTRRQYQIVAKALLNKAIADALRKMREEHEFTRLHLEAAKRAAETVLNAVEKHAHLTRTQYARIVPKQRTASGIVAPPTISDSIITMGQANKFYLLARDAAGLRRDAMLKVRSTTLELAEHLGKIESALVVRELDVRKHYRTPAGRIELEADPKLSELAVQCAAIELERFEYKARQELGIVPDEEQRDRTMALDGYRYLDGDVRGLHCLHQREVQFGALRYLMFRDSDDRIWMLDYAVDLLPLTQMRFDVIYQHERYLVQRSPPPPQLAPEKKKRVTHDGVDPRQYVGVDPVLRIAIKNFVNREKPN